MRSRRSIRATVAGLTVVVALASVGGAAAATGPTNTGAILRAGVIVAGDVPSGWTPGPHPKKSDKNLRSIPTCKAVITADAVAERSASQARSATFRDPTNGGKTTSAQNTVFVFKNTAAAGRFVAVYLTNDAAECLRASVARQVGSPATVSPIVDFGNLGTSRVGYEIVVQGSATNGQPASLYADIVLVRVGRAVAGFDFLNLNARLPQEPGIVNAVVNRLV